MRTITVAGGTLYQLALQYLGDAPQRNRIAQLNGRSDPMIQRVMTLKIPAVNATATGGVYVR